MLLVGSEALSSRLIKLDRKPRDVDLIGTFSEIQDFIRKLPHLLETYPLDEKKYVAKTKLKIYEFEIAWPGSTAEELLRRHNSSSLGPANLDELLTLKLSHRYLKDSPHFLKTMRDIQLLRLRGAKVFDEGWLKRREKETYTYKHPKLNVMKNDFFAGDGVQYVYDHDDIHRAVAALSMPAYEFYKPPGSEVMCSKEMFFAADEQIRLLGVLEEAYVLALERSQIPFKGQKTSRWSFEKALMKVCTSITSGWFREYAWENYDRVVEMYDDRYVDRFWARVNVGDVRKFRPSHPKENVVG